MSPDLEPGGRPNIISLSAELLRNGRVLPTAAQIAFTGEDAFLAEVFSTLAGTITMRARWLDAETGTILPVSQVFPYAAFVAAQVLYPPGKGYILGANFAAHNTNDVLTSAAPYVIVFMVRGINVDSQTILNTIGYGYSGISVEYAWPGAVNRFAFEGPGYSTWRSGTQPAAGVEILETVSSFVEWRPRSIRFSLATSATVVNRIVRLLLGTSTASQRILVSAQLAQPASTTYFYNFYVGAPNITVVPVDQVAASLPDRWRMLSGDRFLTITSGLQAGDQYSAPQYHNDEFAQVL